MIKISKFKLTFIGALLGAVGGYAYYYFVGCKTGNCVISAHPINSLLYGALMGGLLLNIFEKEQVSDKEKSDAKQKE